MSFFARRRRCEKLLGQVKTGQPKHSSIKALHHPVSRHTLVAPLGRTNPYTNSNFEAVRVAEFARTLEGPAVHPCTMMISEHHRYICPLVDPQDSSLQRAHGGQGLRLQRDAQIGLEDPELVEFVMPTAPGGLWLQAISRVAFHPKIPVVATACDDHTWKMWSMPEGANEPLMFQSHFSRSEVAPLPCECASPTGQLVLSGEGHRRATLRTSRVCGAI